jgi:hypothetical protein
MDELDQLLIGQTLGGGPAAVNRADDWPVISRSAIGVGFLPRIAII